MGIVMALKFAEVPGGGSFAPGAGPSWFEMANRQIASLWTGEVSLVLPWKTIMVCWCRWIRNLVLCTAPGPTRLVQRARLLRKQLGVTRQAAELRTGANQW